MKKGTKGMSIALIGMGPKAKGGDSKSYDSEDEDDGDDIAMSAADALIAAVGEKDPEAVVSAFKSLMESC